MRGRHVVRVGEKPTPSVLAHMAGHPAVAMQDLDHVGRGTHLHRFMDQLVGHRVVTRIELHVIIDVHFGRLPLGPSLEESGLAVSGPSIYRETGWRLRRFSAILAP